MSLNLPVKLRFSDDKLPEFKEVRGKDYIFYGEKNDYPQKLLELFHRSPSHSAIVQQKAALISGDSVSIIGNLSTEQTAIAEKALSDINRYEDYDTVRRKFDLDVELYGGGCLEILWSKDKTRIAEVHHVDFSNVRANANHSMLYYAEQWGEYLKKDEITAVPAYNEKTREARQFYYYVQYTPGVDVYPLPGYIGGRQYIATDAEISNWHYNNLKNGFSNGMLLQLFKGVPTDEEIREATRKFKKQTTGTDNAGGVLLQFNEKDEQPASITPIQPSDLDKQFQQLADMVQQQVFIAHRITSPMLFGVRVDGELGGRNELMQAHKLFVRNYVEPKQKAHDRLFSDLISLKVGQPVKLQTENKEPIEADVIELYSAGILDRNEVRTALGYEAIETAPAQPAAQQMNEANPFGWKDSDIAVFSKYGHSAADFEDVTPTKFATLTDAEKSVISLLADNPKITTAEVADITGLAIDEVNTIVKDLTDAKMIKPAGGGTIVITPTGETAIDDSGGQQSRIFVMWEYAKAPGVDGPSVKDTTRQFCRDLAGLNRVYTRQDIDAMSAELGYDVWKRRGGWYHNPKTGTNTPFCRHVWQQKVMRRRVS